MIDTTPITAQITRLIATGTTEQALLAAVAHMFPGLTTAELSQPSRRRQPRLRNGLRGGTRWRGASDRAPVPSGTPTT